jgi:hypothetical protein
MTDWRHTARRVTMLVSLAASPNEHEAARARERAWAVIASIDPELLDTLAEQRDALIEDSLAELTRLNQYNARPNAGTTALVSRSRQLLAHYRDIDALPAIVALLKTTEGEQ